MKIAILEAGRPPEPLIARYGDYPDMIQKLLGPDLGDYETYDVAAGQLPFAGEHHACLVTGSPAGVYEPLPWVEDLLQFLRHSGRGTKLVGICFGHQAMAQAFGGHVQKVERGWGIGLHDYPVVHREPWMDDAALVSAPASHQDQVVMPPPRSEVLLSSVFTPYAGLSWTDRKAISFQFHPEFSPDYAAALIETRRHILAKADEAVASLGRPNDNDRIGGWIRRFLLS